ncbi:hypothetical protein LUX34_29100 [Streptomyces werraensis]|nr:hypothetical protein [Streptomyces werraensis]
MATMPVVDPARRRASLVAPVALRRDQIRQAASSPGASVAGSVFSPCSAARSSRRWQAWRTKASTPLTVTRPM